MIKKTKAKKVDERSEYEKETQNNEYTFREMIKVLRPDIYVLMDMMDKVRFNPIVLFQVMRNANNIVMGNKYGKVTIQIENGIVTFVHGEETTKLNEPVTLPTIKITP